MKDKPTPLNSLMTGPEAYRALALMLGAAVQANVSHWIGEIRERFKLRIEATKSIKSNPKRSFHKLISC